MKELYIHVRVIHACVCTCVLYRQEETKYQMEVRGEMVAMETTLAAAKRDYQLLRIDYEKTLASNEQAAPIAK